MTIKIYIGTNMDRDEKLIDNNTSIREALNEAHIPYDTTTVYLDGAPLKAGEMDKTFADFGVTSECYLIAAEKTNNR